MISVIKNSYKFELKSDEKDLDSFKSEFLKNDEFIIIPKFLSDGLISEIQLEVEKTKSDAHRTYIPNHKKGGSVPRPILEKKSPTLISLYTSDTLLKFFDAITDKELLPCPKRDLHACALYLYTEEGDHINYHFDTSYYKGERYTALLGVINQSRSVLDYELFHKKKDREVSSGSAAIEPGTLVFFNGDKLRHRVTPSAAGDERIVVTFEYVTNSDMPIINKFISNMKDAIAYFGFRKVFGRSGL